MRNAMDMLKQLRAMLINEAGFEQFDKHQPHNLKWERYNVLLVSGKESPYAETATLMKCGFFVKGYYLLNYDSTAEVFAEIWQEIAKEEVCA
jgi:hypothetical protein